MLVSFNDKGSRRASHAERSAPEELKDTVPDIQLMVFLSLGRCCWMRHKTIIPPQDISRQLMRSFQSTKPDIPIQVCQNTLHCMTCIPLSSNAESINDRSANKDSLGSKCHGFHDVSSKTDTTVEKDGDFVANSVCSLGKYIEGAHSPVIQSAT